MGVVLDFNFKRGAEWCDIIDGARFFMRAATSADFRAAEAAAAERLVMAARGVETLAELGLPSPAPEDLQDPSSAIGYSRQIMAVELAMRVVSDWDGVMAADERGEPVAVALSARAMSAFLIDPMRHAAFEAVAYRRIGSVSAEGKKSPPRPNGSPAGAATTAGDAQTKAPPAPGAAAEKTGPAVH